MSRTVEDLTDFSLIEDAIADFIEASSDLPEIDGKSKSYWSGFDFERSRPYAVINPITQSTQGQAWTSLDKTGSYLKYTLYHPFKMTVSVSFFTDNYDEETREPIREDARRYAQRLYNRAAENTNLLSSVNIAYHPMNQNVNAIIVQEDDKYIKQATIDLMFSGVAETRITETDYFETIADPTINLT